MRVLIISQYFYPEEFRVNDMAKSFKDLGHEVCVLTGQPNYPGGSFFKGHSFWGPSRENYKGISVLRVPVIPRGKGGSLRLILNYISFVLFATFLGLPRLQGKFDVCVVFATSPITACFPAIFYKWFKKTPVAVWVQDLWPEILSGLGVIRSSFLISCVGLMVRFIYANCNKILIQSEAFRESVKKWGGKEEQIIFVPNWAEDFNEKVDKTNVIPIRGNNNFTVLFAGNHGECQALDTSLDAAEKLKENKNIRWVFVGDGREKPRFVEEIHKRGLGENFKLVDRQPSEMMPTFFNQADVLLVTLQKTPVFTMVVPSKIQAYMASSKPIVAAIDGEGKRIIEESGAGLAGSAEDSDQLALNVKNLYEKSEIELENMGRNGFEYYQKHFRKSGVIKELDDLLIEMAKESA